MQKEQENAMDKYTLERKCAMMEYTMCVPPVPECTAAGGLVLQAVGRPPAVRLPVGPGGLSPCCGAAGWWPWLTLAPAMRQLASPLSKTKKNQLPKFKNWDFYIKIWISQFFGKSDRLEARGPRGALQGGALGNSPCYASGSSGPQG